MSVLGHASGQDLGLGNVVTMIGCAMHVEANSHASETPIIAGFATLKVMRGKVCASGSNNQELPDCAT